VAQGTCEKADCVVAATGKCLLSHPDPGECPHFLVGDGAIEGKASGVKPLAVGAQLPSPEKQSGRRFHPGTELGIQEATDIMRARYGHLIGVLGSTDEGKTCFLSSLYLMASGGKLPAPYLFAGSQTLQGFEDRARGLRTWQGGQLPSQLVDHTTLSDPRQPSLLHLAIQESQGERRLYDLLLTDFLANGPTILCCAQRTPRLFDFCSARTASF
jgi:hypothetical protein